MPALPFKLNQDRRRHIRRQTHKVTNWPVYEAGLRQRGSLTVWFTDEAVEAWAAEPRTTRGGQPWYSALAILTALTLRAVFRLAYRQAEGLLGSVVGLLGLALRVPDHTTLSRRAATLEVPRPRRPGGTDAGGDADAGRIVASALTGHDADDGARVDRLLDRVEGPVASFTGDGAYDQANVYDSVAERHPEAAVIIPPRATAMPSAMAETAPTRRDCHLRCIAEHGRMRWQKRSGYDRRSKAETAVARWKQVIGDGLRSRTDERRATEVAVAAHTLNCMLEFGRPSYVRIA